MFAIVKTGGKQFKVQVGETIDVEKLDVEAGGNVRLDQVLFAANDGDVAYGRPLVEGAVVTARVVRQYRGPKLIVFKYKSKSRYRRRTGHRQSLTQLAIQTIEIPGWETARAETRRAAQAPVAAETAPAVQSAPAAEAAPAVETREAAPAVETREAQAWPAVEATPVAGSAAPPGDVLPSINPAAQMEATGGAAVQPIESDPVVGEPAPEKPVAGDAIE